MKTILIILTVFISNALFSQENPWSSEKNVMENPWLSDEQKKQMIEEIRKKEAEEYRLKMEKLREEQKQQAEQFQKSDTVVKTYSAEKIEPVKNISAEERLKELRSKNVDIYALGYNDSKKNYTAGGMGVGAFFITFLPIVGNPIVWIIAATSPTTSEITKEDFKNKELLIDKEYKAGYKKAAKNTRAGKMMLGNLLSNTIKIILFVTIMN